MDNSREWGRNVLVKSSAKKAAPAKKAARTVVETSKKKVPVGPQHRVYVIEVKHLQPGIDWDYYVGYTNNFLKVRWEKYEQLADSVAKVFRDRKVKALEYRYDLMKGWGPYATKELGEIAEGDLALYLEDRGYRTYSNELKHAKNRRKDGILMVVPKLPKRRRTKKS